MQGKSQDPTKRLAMVSLAAATLLAGPALADWSNTTPVVGVGGGCPIESRDGNALYTACLLYTSDAADDSKRV